jgi:hypothetical protein
MPLPLSSTLFLIPSDRAAPCDDAARTNGTGFSLPSNLSSKISTCPAGGKKKLPNVIYTAQWSPYASLAASRNLIHSSPFISARAKTPVSSYCTSVLTRAEDAWVLRGAKYSEGSCGPRQSTLRAVLPEYQSWSPSMPSLSYPYAQYFTDVVDSGLRTMSTIVGNITPSVIWNSSYPADIESYSQGFHSWVSVSSH